MIATSNLAHDAQPESAPAGRGPLVVAYGPLGLGIAAAGLIALCLWRLEINAARAVSTAQLATSFPIPAPSIDGLDQHNAMFRLQRYLGRHQIIVGFLGPGDSAASDELRARLPKLCRLNGRFVRVVLVGQGLPQEHRQQFPDCPLPIVSDLTGDVYRRWGCWDEATQQGVPAQFLIDRAGRVRAVDATPRPFPSWDDLLSETGS